MYRELGPDDHRRILGIEPEQVPDVLLLLGMFDVHRGAQRFSAYLEDAQPLRKFPGFLGRSGELKVGLAACFGGPMSALHAHTWCGAGTPVVVQLGWFGALQPGMQLGDVVVPRHAERQDSVSDWYLSKGILSDATPELAATIVASLKARSIAVSEHAIYSTPALLAESREVITDWSRHGWQGVDMETASTFAVAKALGAKRAAALMRIDDHVSEEDSLATHMPAERLAILRGREREVVEAVLEAVAALKSP
jgi:uridine phosphorylase